MEIALEAREKLFGMLASSSWLVLVQNNRPVCIPAGAVQPHEAFTLGRFPFFMKYLQGGFVRMENCSLEQLHMQPVIDGSQILLRRPQNPVGHSLTAQRDAPAVQLLLLTVQRAAHDELLRHNIRNGLRRGKAAGNDTFLPGCFHNRCLNAGFIALPAGVGIVDVLLHNDLGRLDFQLVDDLFADFGHGIAAFRAYQILALQTVLHHLSRGALGDVLQRETGLFALLTGGRRSGLLLRFLLRTDLRLVEQEAQLLHGILGNLLGGRAELLMPGKAQRLHEDRNLLLQFGDALVLSRQFGILLFIFRPGNSDRFRVACLEIIRTFHVLIIPYFSRKVQ